MKAPQRLSVISPQQCVLEAERDENVDHIAQQEHEVRQAEPGQQTVECALHRPGGKRFRGITRHWPSWVQIRGSFAKLNIYTILIFKLIHSTNSKYILSTFWEFNRQEADNNTMNQPSIEPPLHNGGPTYFLASTARLAMFATIPTEATVRANIPSIQNFQSWHSKTCKLT